MDPSASANASRDGPQRSLMVRHRTLRLSRAGLAQLNRFLDCVAEMDAGQDDVKGRDSYTVTMVLSQLSGRPDVR